MFGRNAANFCMQPDVSLITNVSEICSKCADLDLIVTGVNIAGQWCEQAWNKNAE